MDEEIENHWAYEQMDDLINADIIDGVMDKYNNMFVKPNDYVTRAQFVKIIVTALGLENEGNGKAFSDVKAGTWYYDYVQTASSLDIVTGKPGGKFAPNDKITRAEMAKIIVDAFKHSVVFPETSSKAFDDVDAKSWAYQYINQAAAAEIVFGNKNKYSPSNSATRAEAMAIVHRALQKEQSDVVEDAALIAFITDFIKSEDALTEVNDQAGLQELYEANTTGYYKAEMAEYGGDFENIVEEGEEFTFTINDENMAVNVLEKSNHFATVEVSGITVFVKYKSDGLNMDYTFELEGVYKLKKNSNDGGWKIYSYYPYFSEEE